MAVGQNEKATVLGMVKPTELSFSRPKVFTLGHLERGFSPTVCLCLRKPPVSWEHVSSYQSSASRLGAPVLVGDLYQAQQEWQATASRTGGFRFAGFGVVFTDGLFVVQFYLIPAQKQKKKN